MHRYTYPLNTWASSWIASSPDAGHIRITRGKAFIQLEPFFNNKDVLPATKLRAISAVVRSICTYTISTLWVTGENNLRSVQGYFMKLLRSIIQIVWYINNSQIIKEIHITSPFQAAPIFASRFCERVVSHPNPYIAASAKYYPKSYDSVNHTCSFLEYPLDTSIQRLYTHV